MPKKKKEKKKRIEAEKAGEKEYDRLDGGTYSPLLNDCLNIPLPRPQCPLEAHLDPFFM